MAYSFSIDNRQIGPGNLVYIIAEMSANHNQDFSQAVKILKVAKEIGVDALKLQTYTPDTMTINIDSKLFKLGTKSLWSNEKLYDLYKKAYTPWEWYPKLKKIAKSLDLTLFSTAFDSSAVDFLEKMGTPVHKIASFELVDIPLIEKISKTGKPLFISTGMASLNEIREAVNTARHAGAKQIALFKTNSAYPSPLESMNLLTIQDMSQKFHVPIGLSDHSPGIIAPIVAVALGASFIEKHLTLSRSSPSPDSAFSLEPAEFKKMVESIKVTEKTLGKAKYGTKSEQESKLYRRSLFVIKDIKKGEIITYDNIRSIRPGYGLPPKFLNSIVGRHAKNSIKRGTPLSFKLVS